MAKKIRWYRQCRYRRQTGPKSYQEGVSYIEEKLAVVGKPVYFGKKDPRPPQDEMWIITSVSDIRRDGEYMAFKHSADQQQRKASDV